MNRTLLRSLLAEPLHPDESRPGVSSMRAALGGFAARVLDWSSTAPGVGTLMGRGRPLGDLPFTGRAEILLIVPPFASLWYPSLAAHVLQAVAARAGYATDVLYANTLLAAWIGERHYEQIAAESVALAAERFFARCAFGLPPLGHGAAEMFAPSRIYGPERGELYRGLYPDGRAASLGTVEPMSVTRMARLEQGAPAWINDVATAIVRRGYRVVGCTTTFQQTTASIALLNRVKALAPATVTVLGGANCEGEMAEGLAALETGIDYFFAGESDTTFAPFLEAVMRGDAPAGRIVTGTPCRDLDALPFIKSTEYFDQRAHYLRRSAPPSATYLSFETSRGCWWGQKQHCTFCGLNGEGMGFRRKSPARAVDELRALIDESPTKNVSMTDNIMPHDYLKTFLPRLQADVPDVRIFYEQKANLSADDVFALKAAGITMIQPGIEALSSSLLKLMRKGVQARQNVLLLRYSRIAGVRLVWNLLCGFPNDAVESYEETRRLVPLITHLQPPSGMWHLSIDRFSPYYFEPDRHGVSNLRALPVYRDFLPAGAPIDKIAYHFLGDYGCDTHRHIDLVRELNRLVRDWVVAWQRPRRRAPELKIARRGNDYLLVDTRGLPDLPALQRLDRAAAASLLVARPSTGSDEETAAVARRVAVVIDNWFVPLPVAARDLFIQLTRKRQERAA